MDINMKRLFILGNIFVKRLRFFCKKILCKNLRGGNRVGIDSHVKFIFSGKNEGIITIDEYSSISYGSMLITEGGFISIGRNCTINPYCVLYGNGGISIGNNVRIATHCVIVSSNHNFHEICTPICNQGLTTKGITIQDDVWIGAHVTVLDGVNIAMGCVIGAGAVVTKDTKPYGIYVGNPAKLIKFRGENKIN